jgi:hypothetical protein
MKYNASNAARNRKNEKGAALVMALLVSFLLMIASAGLLLEASMNSANVTDATAEQQAYSAAESGIQAAVFVLRDNVTLSDANRLDTSKPATDKANRINYLKAIKPVSSNMTTSGLDTAPRLSRWLSYNGTATDRISMGTGTYIAQNGYAFSLDVSDPDHTGALVTYSSTGHFDDSDGPTDPVLKQQRTYGSGANTIVIKYVDQPSVQVDTTGGSANANFGTIRVTVNGTGALIPSYNRFTIWTTMTQPYAGVRAIRGYIESNTSATMAQAPHIRYDSITYTLQGSVITLVSTGGTLDPSAYLAGPPAGFSAQLNTGSLGSPADSVITGTISSPEPIRLLIKSTGYGPRGSTKHLEAIIQKNFLNGLTAPATLTLIGPPSTGAPNPTTFTFNPGSSNVVDYSGQDQAVGSTDIIPPIGTSNDANLDDVYDSVDGNPPHPFNGNITGAPSNISGDTPPWLSSPSLLDAEIHSFYNVASAAGRYFPNGVTPPDFGNNTTGQGITFCDGDVEFTGNGGGIMIVTGKLTLRGNFSFKGLIIVTGKDGVDRKGAGTGEIQGNMVLAPYLNNKIVDVAPSTDLFPSSTATFLAPQYDLSGGGNSTIAYNSSALNSGLVAVSNFVLGVVEK